MMILYYISSLFIEELEDEKKKKVEGRLSKTGP